MSDFATLRDRMVERQLERRGIDDPALLAAFRAVPREAFVDAAHAGYAYDDSPLPNSTRPLDTRSRVAMRSAVRAGWL